jgi:hypothetical protein
LFPPFVSVLHPPLTSCYCNVLFNLSYLRGQCASAYSRRLHFLGVGEILVILPGFNPSKLRHDGKDEIFPASAADSGGVPDPG